MDGVRNGGWIEMKVGVFAMRPEGEPARPEAWAARFLPASAARVAFVAVELSERFDRRWEACSCSLYGDGTEVAADWLENSRPVVLKSD